MKLLDITFKRHVNPPAFCDTYEKTIGLFKKQQITIQNIDKIYDRQTTKYLSSSGEPYTFFERWFPCECSDGSCEMGKMNKFEVSIQQP